MKPRHPILEATSLSDLRTQLRTQITSLENTENRSEFASAALTKLKKIHQLVSDIEMATSVDDNSPQTQSLFSSLHELAESEIQPNSIAANFIKRAMELVAIRNEERLSRIEQKQRESMKDVVVTIETRRLISEVEKRIATEQDLRKQYPTLGGVRAQIKSLWEVIEIAIPLQNTGANTALNEDLQQHLDKFDSWLNSIPADKKRIDSDLKDWLREKLQHEVETIQQQELSQVSSQNRPLNIAELQSDTSSMSPAATKRIQDLRKFINYLDEWFELPGIAKEDLLTNLRELSTELSTASKNKTRGDSTINAMIKQIETGNLSKKEEKAKANVARPTNKNIREEAIDTLESTSRALLAEHHIDKSTLHFDVAGSDMNRPSVIAVHQIIAINELVKKLKDRIDPQTDMDIQDARQLAQDLVDLRNKINSFSHKNKKLVQTINDLISKANKSSLKKPKSIHIPQITQNKVVDSLLNQLKIRIDAEKELTAQYPNWGQSTEALALQAFIEIINGERLVPRGTIIEHQLRSSIAAFDQWKKSGRETKEKSEPLLENKHETLNVSEKFEVFQQIQEEISRLMDKYHLEEIPLSKEANGPTFLAPTEDNKKLNDHTLDVAITRIMKLKDFNYHLMNRDVTSQELLDDLYTLKNSMSSTSKKGRLGGTITGQTAINNIIKSVIQDINRPLQPDVEKASEIKHVPVIESNRVSPNEKKLNYPQMNYQDLVEAFSNRSKISGTNPFTGVSKAKEKVFNELTIQSENRKMQPSAAHQIRSILIEWDRLNEKTSEQTKKTEKPSHEISKEMRKNVIKSLTQERSNLMMRHGLEQDGEIVIVHNPKNSSITPSAIVIAMQRIMEIDDVLLKLEARTPITQRELHNDLVDLKKKMHNTGIGLTSSTGAKAIQQIINQVNESLQDVRIVNVYEYPDENVRYHHSPLNNVDHTTMLKEESAKKISESKSQQGKSIDYSKMTHEQLVDTFTSRHQNSHTSDTRNLRQLLFSAALYELVIENPDSNIADNHIRSMLKTWDSVKTKTSKPQPKPYFINEKDSLSQSTKKAVLADLNKERSDLMARYGLKEISPYLEGFFDHQFVYVRDADNKIHREDKAVETAIERLMEIDGLVYDINESLITSKQDLRDALVYLKERMVSTGYTSSTSAGAIAGIIKRVDEQDVGPSAGERKTYGDFDSTSTHTKAAPTEVKSSSSTHKPTEVVEQNEDVYSDKDVNELIELLNQRAPNNSPTNHSLESGVLEVITHDSLINIEDAMTEEEPVKLLGRDPQQDMIELKILENQLRSSLKALDLKEQYQNQMSVLTKKQGETEINQSTVNNIIDKLDKEKARIIEKHHLMYITIRDKSSASEDENAIVALVRKDYYKDEKNPDKNKAAETVISRVMEIDNFIAELEENKSISIESVRRGLNELKRRMRSTGFTIATGEGVIQGIIDNDLKVPEKKVERVSQQSQARPHVAEVKKAPVEAKETKEEIAFNDLKDKIANLLIEEKDALLKKHPPIEKKLNSDVLEFTEKKPSEEAKQALTHANEINKMYLKIKREEITTVNEIKDELNKLKAVLPARTNKLKSSAFLRFSKFSSKQKTPPLPPIDRALNLLEKHKAPIESKAHNKSK